MDVVVGIAVKRVHFMVTSGDEQSTRSDIMSNLKIGHTECTKLTSIISST